MKRLLILGLATSVLFTACKKSESVQVQVPAYISDANTFVQKFGPQKQYHAMSTSELPKTITLDNGTKITVPAAAIQMNGNYIAGNLTVEALEFLKRSDIILGGVNTNHIDGSPIESKGMLSIDIIQNDKKADLALQNLMNVSIPSVNGGYVKIIGGNANADGQGQMAWGPQMIDSINSDGSSYSFQTMMIGWLNCGSYFAHQNSMTTIKAMLTNNPGDMATGRGQTGHTFAYFCPKGSNVALQLYGTGSANEVSSKVSAVPMNIEGKLVAFSIKDNRFYYSEGTIVSGQKNLEVLNLAETDVVSLVNKIKELNTY